MKVSVVIPNWNGKRLLEQNLPAVLAMGAGEVIVVDDGSSDQSVAYIKYQISNIKNTKQNLKLIENKKNLGFARAVNRGVAAAKGDIIILLNNDVKPEQGLIDAILSHFKDKRVFGVSFAEAQWSWARGKWVNGFVEHEPGPRTNSPHPTFWVSGGSGAFRKSIWDKLGGFDPIYSPFYWEDIDLSYRAAKQDYKLLWEPLARVVHEHESTISKHFSKNYINFIQERNQLLFIWKNIRSKKLLFEHLLAIVKRLTFSPGYLKVCLAAATHLVSILRSGAKESREVAISDEEIFKQFT